MRGSQVYNSPSFLQQTGQLPTVRRPKTAARFDYADMLLQHIRAMHLPEPIREYPEAIPGRKFRLDLAWPQALVFVECDGGEWVKGSARRHGGATDCERWNLLTLAGWTGFRFVGSQVRSGAAIQVLEQVFNK
jgi:very-short-patch-repair endonuclease